MDIGNVAIAKGASMVIDKPVENALGVKNVSDVAWELPYEILAMEIVKANGAGGAV